jgi:hypothetical protein
MLKKRNMKNKVIIILTLIAGMFSLNSCLKDNVGDYWNDDVAGKMYAQVVKYTLQQQSLKAVPGEVQFSFMVNIATDQVPTEDITLTFGVDTDAMNKYNAANKTVYQLFPNLEILTKTVIIKAGTRNAYVNGKVWGAENLSVTDKYMAPISILSAKTASGKDIMIAGNMKTYFLALQVANPFAGFYDVEMRYFHPTAGGAYPPYTNPDNPFGGVRYYKNQELVTVTANQVVTGFGVWQSDYSMWITINPDNSISLVVDPNWSYSVSLGDPYSSDKVSHYDPATGKIYLYYHYTGSGGDRIFWEVFTPHL